MPAEPSASQESRELSWAERRARNQGAVIDSIFQNIADAEAHFPNEIECAMASIQELDIDKLLADPGFRRLNEIDRSIQVPDPQISDVYAAGKTGVSTTMLFCLWEATRSRSPKQALTLFDTGNLGLLIDRVFFAGAFCHESAPFYNLSELAEKTQSFVEFLEQNRSSLLKDGLPTQRFVLSPYLDQTLGNLYPTRHELLLIHPQSNGTWHSGEPRSALEALLRVGSLDGCCDNEYRGCNCSGMESIKSLSKEKVNKIETDRERLFELKLGIMKVIAKAVKQRSASDLRKHCLHRLTSGLFGHEADFYLGVDQDYTGFNAKKGWLFGSAETKWLPGGMTQILRAINDYEDEIANGNVAEFRDCLRRDGLEPSQIRSYFDLDESQRLHFNMALAQFQSSLRQKPSTTLNFTHWINNALENEFYEMVAVRRKVKRRLAHKFELSAPLGLEMFTGSGADLAAVGSEDTMPPEMTAREILKYYHLPTDDKTYDKLRQRLTRFCKDKPGSRYRKKGVTARNEDQFCFCTAKVKGVIEKFVEDQTKPKG